MIFQAPSNRRSAWRISFIVLSAAVIAYYHFTMIDQHTPMHSVHYRLNYIPILFAAVWFGRAGGIISSLVMTGIYLPHVVFGHGHDPFTGANVYLEFVLYNLVGWLVGDLVTRRVRDQARLDESRRLAQMGEIAAGIAHEIRNPVQTILGALGLLLKREDRGENQQMISTAREEAVRLDALVRDFLSLSRPPALFVIETDLMLLAEQVVERVSIARGKMPAIERTDAIENRHALCDSEQMGRAIRNVIENAVDAAGPHGRIRIGLEDAGKILVFFIEDSGAGVPEEEREKLFEPFYTRKRGGTGLGLSLSQQILAAHNGELSVKSSSLGGARFVFRIPRN